MEFNEREHAAENLDPAEGREVSGGSVPTYFREMGATPLLDREQEAELARGLTDARKKFSDEVRKLPADWREFVLDHELQKAPKRSLWGFRQIDECYERMLAYERAHRTSELAERLTRIKRARREIERCRDALILANLRLVIHIVKRYVNQGLPFSDLIQEGNIGLIKAVEKFEYKKGFKLSTYAYWWIKQAIGRAIDDKARTIRIPIHMASRIKRIRRASKELGEELGRQPTCGEIAEKIQIAVENVEEVMGALHESD
jgi:RNA polymerase primary sigma factor